MRVPSCNFTSSNALDMVVLLLGLHEQAIVPAQSTPRIPEYVFSSLGHFKSAYFGLSSSSLVLTFAFSVLRSIRRAAFFCFFSRRAISFCRFLNVSLAIRPPFQLRVPVRSLCPEYCFSFGFLHAFFAR